MPTPENPDGYMSGKDFDRLFEEEGKPCPVVDEVFRKLEEKWDPIDHTKDNVVQRLNQSALLENSNSA